MASRLRRPVPDGPRVFMHCCLGLVVLVSGCGYPQALPENRELIAALRTACSAKKTEWLEQTVRKIEERKAGGKMGDAEYSALKAIAAKAQAGDWNTAERECRDMQASQRPTAEEQARIPEAARD